EVVDRAELEYDPPLAPAEIDLHSGIEPVRKAVRQILQPRRLNRLAGRGLRLRRLLTLFERDGFLGGADGHALRHDPCRQLFLAVRVLEGEQRTRVPGGQDARGDPAL